jgi:hypothetical protein
MLWILDVFFLEEFYLRGRAVARFLKALGERNEAARSR